MPSPCLLCRHRHRRRRHRYALSFPRSSRRAASSFRAVPSLSSPVTVTVVVVVVVVPSVPRYRRSVGRRPEEEAIPYTARGGSSQRTRRSSASDATSVVATRIIEKEGSFSAWQEGHFGYRYRIRRKEESTEARGEGGGRGGGGGGGSPRGDSPSKCTRCRAERDAASRAKAQTRIEETFRSSSSSSSSSSGSNRNINRSNGTSDDPAVVPPVLAAPAPTSARVFEHVDRRRFQRRATSLPIGRLRRRRRQRRDVGGGGGHGWTPRTVSPRRPCIV